MQKSLDCAIRQQEMSKNVEIYAGYKIGEKVYENYLDNESWEKFKLNMMMNHREAYDLYSLGGGKEMEERKVGNNIYPPKMASFGSSSRMIYNLMKNNTAFLYEKKLSTTIGGTANLDGFIETDDKCVFVEAKCREPYAIKSNEIAEKYKALYEFLSKSLKNNLTCRVIPGKKGKMVVKFFVEQQELRYFDIKQIICHLLGVATAYLNGEYNKKIEFIYLLFNPTELIIENEAHKKEILNIYNNECKECESIDFSGLFYDILLFLRECKNVGVNRDIKEISELFTFRMCDQNTMSV